MADSGQCLVRFETESPNGCQCWSEGTRHGQRVHELGEDVTDLSGLYIQICILGAEHRVVNIYGCHGYIRLRVLMKTSAAPRILDNELKASITQTHFDSTSLSPFEDMGDR